MYRDAEGHGVVPKTEGKIKNIIWWNEKKAFCLYSSYRKFKGWLNNDFS